MLYYGGPSVGISAVSVDECAGSPSPLLLSLSHGTVPQQWKNTCIVAHPAKASDYRPISITPVLSRMLEKHLVRSFVYPALQQPPPGLHFADQFAFRPTGSTDAALLTLLYTVFNMLATQQYVKVFGLDTVRHATVMKKMARLALPDATYNWINDFFKSHSHGTEFFNTTSELADIQARDQLRSLSQHQTLSPRLCLCFRCSTIAVNNVIN